MSGSDRMVPPDDRRSQLAAEAGTHGWPRIQLGLTGPWLEGEATWSAALEEADDVALEVIQAALRWASEREDGDQVLADVDEGGEA